MITSPNSCLRAVRVWACVSMVHGAERRVLLAGCEGFSTQRKLKRLLLLCVTNMSGLFDCLLGLVQ